MVQGALVELVAYGAQDVYLTGNAQITFFKIVYRRHTNFAVENIEQPFNGNVGFGRQVVSVLQRSGDLITKMYVKMTVSGTGGIAQHQDDCDFAWVRRLGHALIEWVEIEIGGSRIDKHYGDWFNIWYDLTREVGQDRGYAKMIGDIPELYELSPARSPKPSYTMWVPLYFWFNRHNGLALPLIALQYHDVRVNLKFREFNDLIVTRNCSASTLASANINLQQACLQVDYVYLDTDERKRFAQSSHEYLIEQLQHTGPESVSNQVVKTRLSYNHPVKALFWVLKVNNYHSGKKFLAYFPGDPERTREMFAKLLFLQSLVSEQNTVDGKCIECIKIVSDSGNFRPVCRCLDNCLFKALVAKICAEVTMNVGVDASGCEVPVPVTLTPDNVTITRTDLTECDISTPIEDLFTGCGDFCRTDCLARYDVSVNQFGNYGLFLNETGNPVNKALIQLNGHDRLSERDGLYYNYVQPWQHWINTPRDGVNSYSFALEPVKHQPSGTVNLSRIDNTVLNITFGLPENAVCGGNTQFFERIFSRTSSELLIFGLNYNVLRIMSGMGGLAYSN